MSRMDKKEIEAELNHQRDVFKRLRETYRTLEKQEASFGLSAPPHIVSEMSRIAERIQQVTERIDQLEIQAVEEGDSLAEAEYRVIVAHAWQDGYLDVVGGAELQLSRLKLKIPIERAERIERDVRKALVRDIFKSIPLDLLWRSIVPERIDAFRIIYKSINLDYIELIDSICKFMQQNRNSNLTSIFMNTSEDITISKHRIEMLEKNIITANNIVYDNDLQLINQTMNYFTQQLESIKYTFKSS